MNDNVYLMMPATGTVEEVLEGYRQKAKPHGNDIDLLMQSIMLIQAGHYTAAWELAERVMPSSSTLVDPPKETDKSMAQAAFLTAIERARPLFEKAALEIEGVVEGSHTMATYEVAREMLEGNSDW